VENFQFFIPVRIIVGNGKIKEIGNVAKKFGTKVMLVMGKSSMKEKNIATMVENLLQSHGLTVEIFGGVKTNPRIEKIVEGTKIAKDFKPEVILGLGGGSVMDTAKAISLSATHIGDLWEYRINGKLGIKEIKSVLIPVITVPTASGTGSEITPAAVICNGTSKEVIVSAFMFPKVAVVDPALTTTVPPKLTARIGIDAFAQAIEAYVSTNANSMSDVFAVEAIKLASTYLPRSVSDGEDIEARTKISLSALFGGVSIILAGVGAVHALSAPLSARYNIHHGHAVSILLLEVMRRNLRACMQKYVRVAEIMSSDIKGMSPQKAAERAITETKSLLENIGLYPHPRLGEFGVKEVDLALLARDAINPDMMTNPKKMTTDEIVDIYRELL